MPFNLDVAYCVEYMIFPSPSIYLPMIGDVTLLHFHFLVPRRQGDITADTTLYIFGLTPYATM